MLLSGWTDPAENEQHLSATRTAWKRLAPLSNGSTYLPTHHWPPARERLRLSFVPSRKMIFQQRWPRVDPTHASRQSVPLLWDAARRTQAPVQERPSPQ